MSEWKEYELSNAIISINTGLDAIRRAPIVNSETFIRCLRIQDISQNKPFSEWGFTDVNTKDFEKYQLQKDDIIIARTGNSIGVNILIKSRLSAVFNNGLARIRVNSNVALSEFIFYLMQTQNFKKYIDAISSGTATQPNMKVGDLSKYKINLPDIETQKKITNYISPIYKKIELNTQTNQTLEQIAQAIFKHWFIDFAPVHAKANALAAGASPEQAELATMASLSGKTLAEITALQHTAPEAYHQLQQTARAFPSEFVESEMGLVPKGWEVKKVKDIAKFIKGKKPKNLSENQQEGLLPYITMATLSGKNISFASPEGMIIADKLDILISMDGSAGNITIGYKGIVGSTFAKINLTSRKYISFFYQFMKNKEEDIKANTTGTSVPHTDKERVLNYSITIPNDDLINYFSKVHLDLLEKILLNKNENNTLENLRDTLLPKLLNGEIEL
ncbi:restriction endonuclease subunit S [Avibacterium paragallinarum]|uniref:EcoKI restriction-modification system protein HsdS n=1 Tax=Avibacterium paragallinarum TaxID=728 RepID=A0A0F5EXH7_AVIPA|nr:restriction endonuclease subunit S [Avibacterium paragallinarum]KAA6209631.1 restriction endonuclease subunit S [Avibacterium paragallinarum]KKB01231.1 hypothetical protein Z012_07565 [Avibacterium paragallinarum]RZN73073.1 restriction endonuclease subunit S [Avibacterium paragallinarum]SUU98155.1 EcoKI restriction-modification system protein HsdS [Avibacterium paragallinarum]